MKDREIEALIASEKEWRRFVVNRLVKLDERYTQIYAWSLVFRLAGSAMFAVVLVVLGWVLTKLP